MTSLQTIRHYQAKVADGPFKVVLSQHLMHQDDLADLFEVELLAPDGSLIDLSDALVQAFMSFPATGHVIPLEGVAVGTVARVCLTEDCYALPGPFTLSLQVLMDGVRRTALRVTGVIDPNGLGDTLIPGSKPGLATLIDLLDALAASSGTLLHVDDTGHVTPLIVGEGLRIADHSLSLTGAYDLSVALTVDESGHGVITGDVVNVGGA